MCAIADHRLAELSGLVSDGGHWYAINDGGRRIQVFVLGRDCAVQRVINDPADPYDVEDLARSADGTLWLADTGDNRKTRDTVALHAVPPSGRSVLYRLTYPDGPHDTEALLLDRSGTPHLVTKSLLGTAEVYRPSRPLATPGPTPLAKVGTVRITATDTPGGPVGGLGSTLVTGGATSADGTVVALRTYTDAYLFPAPDGDVVRALGREPVRVPLPGERQGEAIAFEPDGTLLSGTEGIGEPIRAVEGAAGLAASGKSESPAAGAAGDPASAGTQGAELPTLPGIVVAVALATGAFLLVRRFFGRH